MTEDRLISEEVVNDEIEKLRGLYVARRGLDYEMPAVDVLAAVGELFPELQRLPLEAGAEEVVFDFGNGRVGRRSHIEFTAPDGFLWAAGSVTNLGMGDRFAKGFQHGFVYKQSHISPRVSPQAPHTIRLAQVTRIEPPTGNPVGDVEHSLFAWKAGQEDFGHSAFNRRQGVSNARALIAEFRAIPML